MAIRDRKCLSCATLYKYCPECSKADALAPAWRAQFCSQSCKDLWLIATRYNTNDLTKEDAKSSILELGIKPIESYSVSIQRDLRNIMAEDKKPKRGKRADMKILDEVMEIEPEVVASIIEEQPIEVIETAAIQPIHEVVLEEKE